MSIQTTNAGILRSHSGLTEWTDWKDWIFMKEEVAKTHGIWDYINPDKNATLKAIPPEPTKPELSAFQSTTTMIITPANLQAYNDAVDEYKVAVSKYENLQKSLAVMNLEISSTVANHLRHLLVGLDSPRDRLRVLRDHCSKNK